MFSKILVANRAEVARRVARTCSRMGIATVVVFADHDADAPFVRDAEEAVPLPAGSAYLDGEAIIEAAQRTGAAAIHPGYGFLAESAGFAAAVEAAGITFIGPTPETIASMGSKLHAQAVMHRAGVPVLPTASLGSGDAAAAADEIGYPVLVKASSGGGGKGMRLVTEPGDLDAAIVSASREAASAFGDGTVYLERYVEQPRHVEVQIVGDGAGDVIHLYERECSIQRRFQKIIEETPSPNLDPELKERMWDAAVDGGKAVAYRGVGTVEFIVDPAGGFAFLEMNTRLQVEHTVTELTTGIDLVRMQIELAAGSPLLTQKEVPQQSGHAIEARLNAETPADRYLPSAGTMHRFSVPGDVRVDTGIADGVAITHRYDPMVAKVIAHAPTRTEAAARLARALARSHIHGVDTNRDLLVRVLTDPEFLKGAVDTHFLERKEAVLTAPLADEGSLRSLAAAAALALQAESRAGAPVLGSIPSGWRNVPFQRQRLTLFHGSRPVDVAYSVGRGTVAIAVDDSDVAIDDVHGIDSGSVDISIDGVRRVYSVNIVGDQVYVNGPLGSIGFAVAPRFPKTAAALAVGSMVAQTPGIVVAVLVTVGEAVTAGQSLLVVEAMKMEQAVTAPYAGTVTAVHFDVGDQVDAGSVLLEVEKEDG